MINKASLLLAALLAVPAAALAQTPPPAAPAIPAAPATVGAPPMGAAAPRARFHMDPAEMAKIKAQMDKIRAAHTALRAKMLASLTPAHRALFAGLVGGLAIAANPDPKAAIAKLNAALSTSEKNAILAAHEAAFKQMMAMHPMGDGNMRYQRTIIMKNDDGTTTTTSSDAPGPMAPMPGMHMKHMHHMHPMDAGSMLFEMAQPGDMMEMHMMQFRHDDHVGHSHGTGNGWAPPAPSPAPTP